MPSVLLPMIAAACLNFPSNSIDACNKGSEAFTQQTGIDQNVSQFQHLAEVYANSQAKDLLGNNLNTIASVAFVVNTAVTKTMHIKASPNMGVTANIEPSKYSLGFDWSY